MDPFDLRLWENFSNSSSFPKKELYDSPAYVDEIVIDSRRIFSEDKKNYLFIALKGARTDGHHFVDEAFACGAHWVVVSKEYKPKQEHSGLLFVNDPLKTFHEIVTAYRKTLDTKVVAIVGSVGKTLVKDFLEQMISDKWRTVASPESFNSQIGVPLSILQIRKNDEVALIEAAISLPREMELLAKLIQPNHTIVTPINDKHRASFTTDQHLESEIAKMVDVTDGKGWCLVPKFFSSLSLPCRTYFWDLCEEEKLPFASYLDEGIEKSSYRLQFPDFPSYEGVVKKHASYFLNLVNICAKAAYLLKVPSKTIVEKLKNYRIELMHREIFRSSFGTLFVNGAYCSDLQSLDRDLDVFLNLGKDRRKFFLFGGIKGENKSVGFLTRVANRLIQSSIDEVIFFGDQALEYSKYYSQKKAISKTFVEAVALVKDRLRPEDILLIKGEEKIALEDLQVHFFNSVPHSQCVIDLTAIQHNISLLKNRLGKKVHLMAMVKAQGYGTDLVILSHYLCQRKNAQIDILGVSYVDEAISLRKNGIFKKPIFVLNAAPYEAEKVMLWDLEVGVSDLHSIYRLQKEAKERGCRAKVHLHVDTGMSRFGCLPEEAFSLAKTIIDQSHLVLHGVMTHLVAAEELLQDAFSAQQLEQFQVLVTELESQGIKPCYVHAANTASAIRFSCSSSNLARIGIGLFGLHPSEAVKSDLSLKTAVSLRSYVVGINHCKKGDTISYGRSYEIFKEMAKIAVIPIGYHDGLHRHYSGRAHVAIRGKRAPIVGKICMDYMMVDVTEIAGVEVGDPVLIFGYNEQGHFLSPESFAKEVEAIAHELVTSLGPRVQRVFIED